MLSTDAGRTATRSVSFFDAAAEGFGPRER